VRVIANREATMRKAIGAAALVVALMATPALASGGNAGDDRIQGTVHADVLSGGAGEDRVAGGSGNDELFGGVGADLVIGGRGFDTCHVGWHDIAKGCEVIV